MKLIVDTNIILKALIKDSKVRGILLNPKHQFSVPEYALEETEKHILLVREKTSLSEEEIKHVLNVLLTGIEVIPRTQVVRTLSLVFFLKVMCFLVLTSSKPFFFRISITLR